MIKNLLEKWLILGLNARLAPTACMSGSGLLARSQESKRSGKCL